MDELLPKQEANMRAVVRMVENFKKLGKDKFTVTAAGNRRSLLEQRWQDVRETDIQIRVSASAGDKSSRSYFKLDLFTSAEDSYLEATDFFSNLIEELSAARRTGSHSAGQSPTTTEASTILQLPSIPLPRFSGSYLEWQGFSELFQDLGCLDGSAYQLVIQIPNCDANLHTAWETLRERFENKRVVVAHLVNRILSVLPVGRDVIGDLTHLRETTKQSLALLANMGRPTQSWDDLLVHLTLPKLDAKTREGWEISLGSSRDAPTYRQLDDYLQVRIDSFTATHASRETSAQSSNQPSSRVQRSSSLRAVTTRPEDPLCALCSEKHPLFRCKQFKEFSVLQRQQLVREHRCCANCLRSGHKVPDCSYRFNCARCGKKHHTLLHSEPARPSQPHHPGPSNTQDTPETSETAEAEQPRASSLFCAQALQGSHLHHNDVILATALVRVRAENGRIQTVRALLDQGSESSFATESLAQTLRAPRTRLATRVTGVGGTIIAISRSSVALRLGSCRSTHVEIPVSALVLPQLLAFAPRHFSGDMCWSHLDGLVLADPTPRQTGPIDLILGADIYGALLRRGLRQADVLSPVAQNTVFGWVISGPSVTSTSSARPSTSIAHCGALEDLNSTLRAFWELEELEVPARSRWTPDELKCEEHFRETHHRQPTGRYVVRLPFKRDPPVDVGESFGRAAALLRRVEKRLAGDDALVLSYHAFLGEYENLGHMRRVTEPISRERTRVYLPHHPVQKMTDAGPKFRVVFNASSATSNGSTLNDHLLVGPKLQEDIGVIITRWRVFQYALKADIVKMFRQIRVDTRDVDYQRILWRDSPADEISAFRLETVTYGTACAPFRASRVLHQLANDDSDSHPLARGVLQRHMFVNDALFGAERLEEAERCREDLIALLGGAGFMLSKWASNHPQLLLRSDSVSPSSVELPADDPTGSLAVLGISWDPSADEFHFRCSLLPAPPTKRGILSTVAKLYDPLGWLSPVVISAKILIQELWILKADWDDQLPSDTLQRWQVFTAAFLDLQHIRIPRWLRTSSSVSRVELHGFSDASSRAYAAMVYLRVTTADGEVATSPLSAKTKVSPVKTISVPRLQLCGAVLLVKLLKHVTSRLDIRPDDVQAWTDSTVVLAWLSRHPSSWQVFEALPGLSWRHVLSGDNPADCASRGVTPRELSASSRWWQGPSWLRKEHSCWPHAYPPPPAAPLPQTRTLSAHLRGEISAEPLEHVTSRFSSWPRLLRVTAVCLRFCHRFQQPDCSEPELGASAIRKAKAAWLGYLQRTSFKAEIAALQEKRPIPTSSKLRAQNPFLDDSGLLRVGGRLSKALLPFGERHPILLPPHRLSELIVQQAHAQTLHGGPQLTLRVLRQEYWLLGARNLVRRAMLNRYSCAFPKAEDTGHKRRTSRSSFASSRGQSTWRSYPTSLPRAFWLPSSASCLVEDALRASAATTGRTSSVLTESCGKPTHAC